MLHFADLLALAERIEVDKHPAHTLKFSQAIVAGKRGYQWSSIETQSIEAMQAMCAMWNNRHTIAAALRARAGAA